MFHVKHIDKAHDTSAACRGTAPTCPTASNPDALNTDPQNLTEAAHDPLCLCGCPHWRWPVRGVEPGESARNLCNMFHVKHIDNPHSICRGAPPQALLRTAWTPDGVQDRGKRAKAQ